MKIFRSAFAIFYNPRGMLRILLHGMIGAVVLFEISVGWAADKVLGIDVSHHNDIEDWQVLQAANISFVILKATDGLVDWPGQKSPIEGSQRLVDVRI